MRLRCAARQDRPRSLQLRRSRRGARKTGEPGQRQVASDDGRRLDLGRLPRRC